MTEEQLADAVMRQEFKKNEKILFDFTYLDNSDALDDVIQNNIELIELDENFKESYQEIVVRFFDLFESIYVYYEDLRRFLDNVHQEHYIDHTIENILLNSEGKCLMLEIFYLYGVMLLLMDRLIPSIARERLVICYSRYVGQNASDLYTKVVKLVRGTGYYYDKESRKETLPKNYPVDFFNRFSIDKKLIEQLIN
jgi:WASH complex subunit strumpellin